MDKKNKNAFTLAETLIVISVMGVIAIITLPQVIKSHIEAKNRVKIKKAMTVYDLAIQKMALDNDIKSEQELRTWADTEERNQCANTSVYFKITKGSGCIFQTGDGISWYINDIMKPVVSVKKINDAEDAINRANTKNDKSAFYFYTLYDRFSGVFRTDDLVYTKNNADSETAENLQDLFDWLANKKDNEINDNTIGDNQTGEPEENSEPQIPSYSCNSNGCCANYLGGYCSEITLPTVKVVDPNGRQTNSCSGCTSENECTSCNNTIYDKIGTDTNGNDIEIRYLGWACSGKDFSSCPEPTSGNSFIIYNGDTPSADLYNCTGTSCTCAARRWPDTVCEPYKDQINDSFSKQGLNYRIE